MLAKAVEVDTARRRRAATFGSRVHDPIHYASENPPWKANALYPAALLLAGGIEGKASTGRRYCRARLPEAYFHAPPASRESVRFDTREPTSASYERSDICVVPAAGVAAEAMVALVLANLAR